MKFKEGFLSTILIVKTTQNLLLENTIVFIWSTMKYLKTSNKQSKEKNNLKNGREQNKFINF